MKLKVATGRSSESKFGTCNLSTQIDNAQIHGEFGLAVRRLAERRGGLSRRERVRHRRGRGREFDGSRLLGRTRASEV